MALLSTITDLYRSAKLKSYLRINLINPKQFSSLLRQLSFCSLSYLSIELFGDEPDSIQSYTSFIASTDIPINYKISISHIYCVLTESQPSSHLLPTANNKLTGYLKLCGFKTSNEILTNFVNQFSCIENISHQPKSDSGWSIFCHSYLTTAKLRDFTYGTLILTCSRQQILYRVSPHWKSYNGTKRKHTLHYLTYRLTTFSVV